MLLFITNYKALKKEKNKNYTIVYNSKIIYAHLREKKGLLQVLLYYSSSPNNAY